MGTIIIFVHLTSAFSLPQVYGLIYLHFCRVVKLHRQGTNWKIPPPYSVVWQISCVVWSEEKCEQWVPVKCPWPLSVKPLNDIYYSTTIFAYHFKWFIQWVIWNRDTTVQYTHTLMYVFPPYMINWCYSGITMYLVYSYWCPGTIILKSISLSTHQSWINHSTT